MVSLFKKRLRGWGGRASDRDHMCPAEPKIFIVGPLQAEFVDPCCEGQAKEVEARSWRELGGGL
jgi:hypothetical protein